MCLIVEDLLALEFSIKYGKIVGISLSPLKYIYGFSVVGCLLATLDAAAVNSKKKSHRCLSSEPQSPLGVPCPCWVRVVPMGVHCAPHHLLRLQAGVAAPANINQGAWFVS